MMEESKHIVEYELDFLHYFLWSSSYLSSDAMLHKCLVWILFSLLSKDTMVVLNYLWQDLELSESHNVIITLMNKNVIIMVIKAK